MRVAVGKLEGVESVDVSLTRASTDIRLRSGNRVRLADLRQIVKDNGFTSKEAIVTVAGTLVERGGRPALQSTGTNEVWLLASDPKQPAAYADAAKRLTSKSTQAVEVTGLAAPPADPSRPEQLVVHGVR